MAMFSGGWLRQVLPSPQVPIVAPLDPAHSTPQADPNNPDGPHRWTQSAVGPTLDPTLTEDTSSDPVVAPGAPINMTPWDHQDGTGYGAGLDEDQAIAIDAVANQRDLGAPAVHLTAPMIGRDGQPHLSQVADVQEGEWSPETVKIRYETGVGSPYDPNARLGLRYFKRWYDRVIDMHWYTPMYQPNYETSAYTAPTQPAGDSQHVSPYPTLQYMGSPDQFLQPQMRRVPEPVDYSNTVDTSQIAEMTANYTGITPWGL